ncbi:glycosyl transferase [Pseudohongiella nitratireducens]|uniref:Glycosyl transferase n=1 Tax=Pseudohongiella nitratireducens TaxID=1768907 RepID=A0A916VIP6_9GAMM|nr:glycosyltransferase family 2 protein [Pseudohongiella nitratireducens]GFZ77162.1 glycosyl transferase [Pseudohongiella nitratireducens]
MAAKLKFSIVTACYNSGATISQAIASLKKQSWAEIEHLVIDGSSTDDTQKIAQSTLGDQDVFVSEPDKGIYDALNKGISLSTGDVIGFLHSDDFLAKETVLQRVAKLFLSSGADAVYGDLQYVSADDPTRIIRNWHSGEFQLSKLRRGWMPPHPAFFMKRDLYESLGAFDTELRIASDYDSMLRYLNRSTIKVAYIPEVLVKMRVGGASNGSLKQIIRKSKEDFAVMKKHGLNPFIALPYKNLSKIHQFFIRN